MTFKIFDDSFGAVTSLSPLMFSAYAEAVVFVAILVGLYVLVRLAWRRFSVRGQAKQIADNTAEVIEHVDQTCPIHGHQPGWTLVVGEDGEPQCSLCFANARERATADAKARRADGGPTPRPKSK